MRPDDTLLVIRAGTSSSFEVGPLVPNQLKYIRSCDHAIKSGVKFYVGVPLNF